MYPMECRRGGLGGDGQGAHQTWAMGWRRILMDALEAALSSSHRPTFHGAEHGTGEVMGVVWFGAAGVCRARR